MTGAVAISTAKDGLRFGLRVSPGSSRDAILGVYGDRLKVSVRAAPEKGKANRAALRLLSAALDLPRGSVEIVAGAGSPSKTVSVTGLDRVTLSARIAAAVAAAGKEGT